MWNGWNTHGRNRRRRLLHQEALEEARTGRKLAGSYKYNWQNPNCNAVSAVPNVPSGTGCVAAAPSPVMPPPPPSRPPPPKSSSGSSSSSDDDNDDDDSWSSGSGGWGWGRR